MHLALAKKKTEQKMYKKVWMEAAKMVKFYICRVLKRQSHLMGTNKPNNGCLMAKFHYFFNSSHTTFQKYQMSWATELNKLANWKMQKYLEPFFYRPPPPPIQFVNPFIQPI